MRIPPSLSSWSDWYPLRGIGRERAISPKAGLYRIRRVGRESLDYVGQTGVSLRSRLGMLSGVYRDDMPYGDPHTAGPALWALRDALGCEFEASVTVFEGSAPERKALECLAISQHRLAYGTSPTANFGRMPDGYRKSSGNNRALVDAGKRFRGGADPSATPSPPSEEVHGDLTSDPLSLQWLGWDWTPWADVEDANVNPASVGLYRLRNRAVSDAELAYVGQGRIASRVAAHTAKGRRLDHTQSFWFGHGLEVSWAVVAEFTPTLLLEHENDLIASHVLVFERCPLAQFLG